MTEHSSFGDLSRFAILGLAAVTVSFASIPAHAAKKEGVVMYDKKTGKPYCKFKDGTYIDPPFSGTTTADGIKTCHANSVISSGTSDIYEYRHGRIEAGSYTVAPGSVATGSATPGTAIYGSPASGLAPSVSVNSGAASAYSTGNAVSGSYIQGMTMQGPRVNVSATPPQNVQGEKKPDNPRQEPQSPHP